MKGVDSTNPNRLFQDSWDFVRKNKNMDNVSVNYWVITVLTFIYLFLLLFKSKVLKYSSILYFSYTILYITLSHYVSDSVLFCIILLHSFLSVFQLIVTIFIALFWDKIRDYLSQDT